MTHHLNNLDITDDSMVQQAFELVQKTLNGKDLNCLINNAGVAAKLKYSDINEKTMIESYRQNVIGPWKMMKVTSNVDLVEDPFKKTITSIFSDIFAVTGKSFISTETTRCETIIDN